MLFSRSDITLKQPYSSLLLPMADNDTDELLLEEELVEDNEESLL